MPAAAVARQDFAWGAASGPAALVAEVRRRCRELDGHDPLDEAAALHLKHDVLATAALWVTEHGFALQQGRAVALAVGPEARGRGEGANLAAASLAGSEPVTAWSHGDHPAAGRLAQRHGLHRARELWVMRRPTDVELPGLEVPIGVTVRAYRDSDADELLRVNAAAFATHPEQAGMDADDLALRMGEDWFDPDGLLIAEEGGKLLGFHWTKQHDTAHGEVYVISVDPAAQGRGLGRVLTIAGLQHLAGLGVSEVLLYVESDNAAGLRLYTGLGFTHAERDTHVQYRRN